jgi:hypothetical protein
MSRGGHGKVVGLMIAIVIVLAFKPMQAGAPSFVQKAVERFAKRG